MDKSIFCIIGFIVVVLALTVSAELWFPSLGPAPEKTIDQLKIQHLIKMQEELKTCLAILKSDVVYSPVPAYCE